jgi:hypothetical protein
MCRRPTCVILLVWLVGIAAGDPLRQGPGPDWIVSVEAEHYDANIENPPHTWDHITMEANGFMPPGGFSGGEAMQSQPTTPGGGAGFNTGYVDSSPRLDYEISFIKAGTYYVWVLGYGHDGNSDSLHAGLDGQGFASCDRMSGINGSYNWTNSTMDPERATLEVTSLGLHTLNIWMREDGSVVDKIVLTRNESYTPTGSGPPESFREPQLKAYAPDPVDGANAVTAPLFEWTPGETALMSKVYLGTTEELGDDDLVATTPVPLYWHGPGLTPGTTYYWRVDSLEADMVTVYEGDVWTFAVPPAAAWMPKPPDGVNYVDPNAVVAWTAGMNAITHDVYLSENEADVAAGAETALVAGSTPSTTLAVGLLEKGTTYYWRVDEMTAMGEKTAGEVWSFTTLADIAITDPHLLGWWKLDEGYGERANDFSGHENHGEVRGDPAWIEGFDGLAVELDGTGNQYIVTGTWNPSGADITVSLWAKWNGISGQWQGMVAKRDGWAADDMMWHIEAHQTSGIVRVGREGIPQIESEPMTEGEWEHWAFTFDGANVTIYRNAHAVATGPFSYGTDPNASLNIGSATAAGGNPFNGALDDIRIYDEVLMPDELALVMRIDLAKAWDPSPRSGVTTDALAAFPMTWKAGDGAVQHDVYLGTDETAVAEADTSDGTGIYRGRQNATSLTPVPELAWGMSYYWRIDEVAADGTITKGRVWSFTLTDFLTVDDFESYTNDSPNRVFQTWVDGLGFSGDEFFPNGNPGNGSGALAGHDIWSPTSPHFEGSIMETGNVHGGAQAMPLYYNNADMPYYSQVDRTFAPVQNWTLGGVDTLQVFVHGQATGLIETGPDSFIMSGAGADIWGMSDEFTYLYKRLNGDGSLTVRVDSLENTNDWAKVGVMIRDSLDPDSKNAMAYVTPNGRVGWQYRELTSGNSSSTRSDPGAVTTPYWVRLTRTGDMIKAEHSADGVTWEPMVEVANPDEPSELVIGMRPGAFIGLAVTSHSAGVVNTAEFSNVSSTGGVTGQWQSAEIGVDHMLNDPADLYVTVQDSTGRAATVKYDDGALFDEWTALDIPLADIAGAGVDLSRIAKMTVGVGDPDSRAPDGSGVVLVDDITVRLPAPAPDGDGAQ